MRCVTLTEATEIGQNNMNKTITDMKKLALTLTALLGFATIWGQSTPKADTTTFPIGDTEIIVINKNIEKSDSLNIDDIDNDDDDDSNFAFWDGLDLGMNFLLTSNNDSKYATKDEWIELDPARSLSWRLNLIEQRIPIAKQYVGLVTGLGVSWNSYSFNKNISLINSTDSIFGVVDSIPEYSKNKIRASYLQVPLMLEFNSSKDKDRAFHLAAGVIGGLRIGTVYKQEYDLDGQEVSVKVRDDWFLSPITLDATARIGYRNLTLWATYGLTPLFKNNKGPEVYPVSIGLSIIPFG